MDKLPDIIYALAALCSVIASILAWVAKIRWSTEFKEAKDASLQAKQSEVEAKNAHIATLQSEIESLKNLTPMKVREYFNSVKVQLTEYNDSLQQQLAGATNDIQSKQSEIDTLKVQGSQHIADIQRLEKEKQELQAAKEELEKKASNISFPNKWYIPPSPLELTLLQDIAHSSKKLGDISKGEARNYYTHIAQLSGQLQQSIIYFPLGYTLHPDGYPITPPPPPKPNPGQSSEKQSE
jgi:predicted RNase H-like nuclease (RuvC/YqgF family)